MLTNYAVTAWQYIDVFILLGNFDLATDLIP